MHTKQSISRIFALVLLLTVTVTQNSLWLGVSAQERNINVNENFDLQALGIKNEAQQIGSLVDVQIKFFKRGDELKKKSILSPRDPASFRDEGEKRKADLVTLKRQFDSLINRLKQGNNWNETFDAQVLAALKNESDRSVLTQSGGARKVLEAGAGEVNQLRDEIDEAVREVNGKQVGSRRIRNDRVNAAHASPPMGALGCAMLLSTYIIAVVTFQHALACAIAQRSNEKGCRPRVNCS